MKLWAFIKRDLLSGMSYKMNLLMGLVGMGLGVLMLYFISKAFGATGARFVARYGGDYFPYVLIGMAVSNFVTVGLETLSGQIRSAQLQGTLEALLGTPTSIYTILIGNSMSTFLRAFASAFVFLTGSIIFIGSEIPPINAAASLVVLVLTFMAFLSIGMLSAGFIMVFKRGNPIDFIFGWSSFFLGGIFFPVDILPLPLRSISQFLPITHAVLAIREMLLARANVISVLPAMGKLLLFILALGPLGVVFFRFAVRRAKMDGSLIQY
jgi:ABC-2 type transport system permease protein